MAKVSFVPRRAHTRDSLIHGIYQWIRRRLKDETAKMPELSKLAESDLLILARAMGYKPPPTEWEIREAAEKAAAKAAALAAPEVVLALPSPDTRRRPNSDGRPIVEAAQMLERWKVPEGTDPTEGG